MSANAKAGLIRKALFQVEAEASKQSDKIFLEEGQ